MTAKGRNDFMNLRLSRWTDGDYAEFLDFLKEQSDKKYRSFHCSLVPGAQRELVLGVRMPRLREIGREISKGNPKSFLDCSNGSFYEERMIRGIVTGLVKTESFEDFRDLFDRFSEEVDNWAICDSFCSGLKEVKKYRKEYFDYLYAYIKSDNEWKIRIALVVMLDFYLDGEYIDAVLKRCDEVKQTSYYVSMARAWLVATACAKCREKTERYLSCNSLDDETFNRAIQKCVESRRIDDDTKKYLKTLKRKKILSD